MNHLKHADLKTLEEAFDTGQGLGYVHEFSDRTFAIYFHEEFGVDIDAEQYRSNGTSKGKRLTTFLMKEHGSFASRVLVSLWDNRSAILARQEREETRGLSDRYFNIVRKLSGQAGVAPLDAIERFVDNETLDELVASIERDVNANKPQAALDRLHTYCMKKFGHLLAIHGGTYEAAEPLHSRVGKYVKLLEPIAQLQPMSHQIIKNSIAVFDRFNSVRNNKTLAHDNQLVTVHEARFIFESISSVLRLIRSVEASHYGG